MGGFSLIRLGIAAAICLAIGGTIFAAYEYVTGLQHDAEMALAKATVEHDRAELEKANATAAMGRIQVLLDAQAASQVKLDALAQEQSRHTEAVNALTDKLSKHDIAKDASKKPALVSAALTRGTNAVILRLNAAGDPLGGQGGGPAKATDQPSGTPAPAPPKPDPAVVGGAGGR
jgi:hypothetical protein